MNLYKWLDKIYETTGLGWKTTGQEFFLTTLQLDENFCWLTLQGDMNFFRMNVQRYMKFYPTNFNGTKTF